MSRGRGCGRWAGEDKEKLPPPPSPPGPEQFLAQFLGYQHNMEELLHNMAGKLGHRGKKFSSRFYSVTWFGVRCDLGHELDEWMLTMVIYHNKGLK
jgi:hypothetical protein